MTCLVMDRMGRVGLISTAIFDSVRIDNFPVTTVRNQRELHLLHHSGVNRAAKVSRTH